MKIIQINASYKPAYIYGGPTMSVSKLSEELVKAGIDLTVFTTTANGETELPVASNAIKLVDGVNVRYFKRLTKDHTHFSPALLWALRREIKAAITQKSKVESGKWKVENDSQPSNISTFQSLSDQTIQQANNSAIQPSNNPIILLHIHAWWNLVSMLSALIAWFYNVPVVLSPRGMLTSYTLGNRNSLPKAFLHWLIGKKLLAYSQIHATSDKEAADVTQTSKVKGITIIPNFVRFPLLVPERKKNEEGLYKLVFLSRIEEKKGLELLFEALVFLKFDWQLEIAGNGTATYIESLKGKVESLGLTKKINWLGQVNDEQKFELLATNDVLVLTSYNENFANVVIESLSVGTPVLLSDQVGLASYVEENNLGWISALSVGQITATITKSYEEVTKRNEINTIAPARIRYDFAEERLIKKYIALYKILT